MDLTAFVVFFPNPLKEHAKLLLQKGILSTAMLRGIDLESLKKAKMISPAAEKVVALMQNSQYFSVVLDSIQTPRQKMFLKVIKVEDRIVLDVDQLPQAIDLMSPPYPLGMRDGMGFHRDGVFSERVEEFGSAIVELRSISGAKKFRKNPKVDFLTIPSQVCGEFTGLFDFLSGLKI